MKKLLTAILLPMLVHAQAQTLEACQQAAERNYPMIRQYELIAKTTDLTVANIQKGWLPQVSATAQATYQSDVTAFPEQIQQVYQTMGINMKGLGKDQYRVGLDIQQMVFDGGAISSRKAVAREQGNVQTAQTEVDIYQVRKRVNEMYFALLLLDKRMVLNSDLQELLAQNEKKLSSMLKGGTAAESDYQNVKAERLGVVQQMTSLEAQRATLARVLSAFCGIEVKTPEAPLSAAEGAANVSVQKRHDALGAVEAASCTSRPELRAIDAQLRLADAQEKALDAALMPQLGVFAQGYYGYPGYNLFEDMMSCRWGFNGMIGARLTWNIGALYTRKSDKARLNVQRAMFNVQRDVFLFNNRLEQIQQNEDIVRYQRLMAEDDEIVRLRSSIRKAAESKLAHGIIDVNDLMREVNAENAARVQQSIHEIEMLKAIYDLKYMVND